MRKFRVAVAGIVLGASSATAMAAEPASGRFGWFSGDWELTVGASTYAAPAYEGDDGVEFKFAPIISFGRAGPEKRFESRNDNISIGIVDTGAFRAGVAGKILFGRDDDDSDDLIGVDPVRWGGEIGAFAEVYPTDWLRLRGEVRKGIRAHDGIVGDVSADAFFDVTPVIRLSGGPRATFASGDYFDTYYGITPAESVASGLAVYDPSGGIKSAGVGGAVTWKATEQVTASVFGEYSRLMGDAKNSSLVQQRGSENQFLFGLSTTYKFGFNVP